MDSDKLCSNDSYTSTLDWLYSQLPMFSRVGAPAYKPGLDMTIALDNLFGNPHRHFRSIHIGGTNGKGSTSHMLASILQEQGYKVGLYTSPHLVDFRERMRINGEMIPKGKVVEFVSRWKEMETELHPSFFELTMMMAFDWFAQEKVDIAVIEVGMGGRLDSTNVITPLLSVITNISFDHTQFLGSTLPQIAAEKAGIIKPGIPAVIGEAEGDVEKVFVERCAEVGASVDLAYTAPAITQCLRTPDGEWCLKTIDGLDIKCPLPGEYQLKNMNTVLHAVKGLRVVGIEISDSSVINGIEGVVRNTGLMGRWTVLSQHPYIVCDTGHNEGGLRYNMTQLSDMMSLRPKATLRMVIGFVSDKAVGEIMHLLPHDATYYLTQASIPRAMNVEKLKEFFDADDIEAKKYLTVSDAYRAALADCSPDDILYIGGSTFVVADLLAAL